MKISYNWLQTFFEEKLPEPKKIVEVLTFHSFEVKEVVSFMDDFVFDIDVLSNRAHDCLSHRGVAKEVSVLFNIKLGREPIKSRDGEFERKLTQNHSKELLVEIREPEFCKRYSVAVLKNMKIEEAPNWLKKRLEALGQKSVNNIVDAVNYLMFELGQPMHAFDMDKLTLDKEGMKKIKVRMANAGEEITTLANEDYEFEGGELLIVDGVSDEPLGIAGIKGGDIARVDENTKNIILESANFDYALLRTTSQKLKLKTEASKRFEYEIAPEYTGEVLLEAVSLIKDVAGGEVEGFEDNYPKKANPYFLGTSLSKINKLLGTAISFDEAFSIFKRLDFSCEKVNAREQILKESQRYLGAEYKYGARIRFDAPLKFDCSSFVSFVFSRAGVRIPRVSVDQYVFGEEISFENISPGDLIFANTEKEINGVIHFKTIDFMKGFEVPEGIDLVAIYLGDGKMIYANNKEGVVVEKLNESCIAQKIKGCRRMFKEDERILIKVPPERIDLRREEDLVEEVGRIYGYENVKAKSPEVFKEDIEVNKQYYFAEIVKDILTEHGFSEVYTYAFRDEGEVECENPIASDKAFLRNNLSSGILESLDFNSKNADLLALEEIKIFEIGKVFRKREEYQALSIGVLNMGKNKELCSPKEKLQEVVLKIEEVLGVSFKSKIDVKKDGNGEKAIIEENFEELIKELETPKNYENIKKPKLDEKFKKISSFPFVLRDIAVWAPKDVSSKELIDLILETAGGIIVNNRLFDEYHKDESISFAFRLVFQSSQKTLSDEEVNAVMEKIYEKLKKRNWQVR